MKFEEQFPSLNKIANVEGITFTKECLLKNCLDKQKVKEVINKIYNSRSKTCGAEWMDFANELEKELNLKED